MKRKKGLIFDLDGTLVDSMGHLTSLAARIMEKHFGLRVAEASKLYQKTSGLPFFEQLHFIYPLETEKNKTASEEFEEEKRKTYFEEKPYPDTLETLEWLKAKGYKIAISSNSDDELVQVLAKKLGLVFDWASGYRSQFPKGKPHFDAIIKAWKTPPSELIFIGDSLKDGEKAADTTIDFIGKTGTFLHSDFKKNFPQAPIIKDLQDLKRILG